MVYRRKTTVSGDASTQASALGDFEADASAELGSLGLTLDGAVSSDVVAPPSPPPPPPEWSFEGSATAALSAASCCALRLGAALACWQAER